MRRQAMALLGGLMLLFALPANGQGLPMLHFTKNDGLPSNTIYSLYKDSKGFLWVATDKGVARYNGIKFETFTTFDGLSDNEVFFFQEDHSGRLWLATYNGELCYYKNDTFHRAANTSYLKLPIKTAHIAYIGLEKDSSITIQFLNKSIFVNIKNEKLKVFNLENEMERRGIKGQYFFTKKLDGQIYNLTGADFEITIDTGEKVISYREVTFDPIFSLRQNQNLMFTFNKYFISFNGDTVRDYTKNLKGQVNQFYYDGHQLYIVSNYGLFRAHDSAVLFKGKVSTLVQDNQDHYWISTLDNGIYIFNRNYKTTRLYENVYDGKVNFGRLLKGQMVFSSNSGLYLLSGNMVKSILYYRDHDKNFYDYPIEPVFLFDKNNRFYCCYSQTCITIDSLLSGKKTVHFFKSDKPPMVTYYKSLGFAGSRLYLQSRISVSVLDVLKLGVDRNFPMTELNTGNGSDRIFTMAIAGDSSIWYSTVKSVFKIKNDQGVPQTQFKDISFKFFNFYGKHLIGYTHNNQLLICSNVDGDISIDSVASQNCIWDKLYRINDSSILISTNNYYRLLTIPASGYVRKYRIAILEDPFLPLECEYVCFDSSMAYFFKNGSILTVDISNLSAKPRLPELFFTFLKSSKATYRISDLIEIPYSESKNINLSFATLSHGNRNISYQFSVSKTGQEVWNDAKGDVINLVNPGYGQYVIKVKARTLSNNFSEPIVFTLHILRPYWATWWFVALCLCAACAVIGGAIRYRFLYIVRKNKKAHDTEVKFIRSEFKSINALMNPHFIFNTLNNVQSLFNGNDRLAANEYLRVFADLIRQNMHNVSKELIPLQKEMALVLNYLMLEKLRFDDKLQYNINVDEALDLSDIMVPPLLIQPLIENSIKHGILPLKNKQGVVEINIFEKSGVLSIEVRDNGPGMAEGNAEKAEAHESFGMTSIKKRIAQLSIIQNKEISFHAGEIKDDNGNHLWTVVTITMPVSE